MKNKIMTHVVAGYPNKKECLELMLGMQTAGVFAIEVQLPFSDPGADGPTIMKANDIALEIGMNIDATFALIAKSRKQGFKTPLYIMSYTNKLFRYGFEDFCRNASKCQVSGLIIPDLPFDSPEHEELLGYCNEFNLELVPVLSPGIKVDRLEMYKLSSKKLIYVTSAKGITGKELSIKVELKGLLRMIRAESNCLVALGFGIRTKNHIEQALEIADIAVIGSEIVRVTEKKGVSGAIKFIKSLVKLRTSY